MKTAIIVQQRLRNTRLPCKGRLLLNGHSVTDEVLQRCKQVGAEIQVVLAVPDNADDDCWSEEVDRAGVILFRGPERNVLKRYRMAADHVGADIIMRVTADCPLIDPDVCRKVLVQREQYGLAYCCNNMPRTFPWGYDCEAFTLGMLHHVDDTATDPDDREHVTPMMRRLVANAEHVNVVSPRDLSHLRLTLDTYEDYVLISKEFERRGKMRMAAE